MILLLALVLSLTINFNSYAIATPSNMSYDPEDVVIEYNSNWEEELSNEELEIFSSEYVDNVTTSDRDFASYVKDIFITALTEVLPMDDLVKDVPESVETAHDSPALLSSPQLRSSGASEGYKNVVVFKGRFNNTDASLIVPYDTYKNLTIVDGYLVNVGNSNITGKILYSGDQLDPSDYDTYSYILNPIYGSTSNVYQYGSFNYQRHYYVRSGYNSITYTDTYGNFYVDDTDVYYSASERIYYLLMVILLFMGVNWLWSRRH